MKKQQKIIELRTAAKLKIAEIQTKIAFARSEAAEKRARLMCDRAADLEGLEAGSTERFDALAKYRSHLSWVEAHLSATVAECRLEIQKIKAECEQKCAAAEDDYETEEDNDNDVTVKGFQPKQETVYCDGSEHSARIVARRLINKMPRIKCDGALLVHIVCDAEGEYFVTVSEQSKKAEEYISTIFSKDEHCEQSEALFVEKARKKFKSYEDKGNSHVAEPMARALDAIFGGNPMEQVDNLVADTINSGKEGGDE